MKVTREEREKFVSVCEHYNTPDDEVLLMREAANRDPEGWRECFAEMWREINASK